MNTNGDFKSPQEELAEQITALRKQSVLALFIALIFILTTVYLIVSLNSKKKEVDKLNSHLMVSDSVLRENLLALKKLSDSIQHLNKELDSWRVSLIDERTKETAQARYDLQSLSRVPRIRRAVVNSDVFFGYIVYIQDRKNSRVSDTLKTALSKLGAIVPDIQHMKPTMKFSNTIKYFHPQDKETAEKIQDELTAILDMKQIGVGSTGLRVVYVPKKKVPVGQFEVWIDR